MMSSTKETGLKTRLLKLECHFTWALNKNDTDLNDLLNRLEEQLNLNLGKKVELARTYNYMGFVKFLLDINSEALNFFERSVELTKSHGNDCDQLLVVVYGDLAWLHYEMGNFVESEIFLNKLNEIKEKYSSAPYAEVLGEKGWTFLKFSWKYYKRAEECFKKALEMEPEEGEWNAGLAIVLQRTTDFNDDASASVAVDQLKQAIATNPDDDVLKVLLALCLTCQKNYSEAESLVEEALVKSAEHPHVIRYVGKFLRCKGSVGRSITLLERALERGSNSAFIHHQLGLCHKRRIMNIKKDHHKKDSEINQARQQCINHLKKATTLKPSFIMAMSELALQYGYQDTQRAEEMFQASFHQAEGKNVDYQFVLLCYAEFQQHCLRCESAAIRYYTECLTMNPTRFEGRKSAERLEEIRIEANTRIENNPMDGEAFGILGLIHKERGEKQEAIECFEKALDYVDNEDYLNYLCEHRLSLQ